MRLERIAGTAITPRTATAATSVKIASFTTKTKKFNMDIAAAKKIQPELKALVAELTEKQKTTMDDTEKLAALEKQLKQDETALNKAKRAAEKMEEAVQQIQSAIDNVGGIKLKAARSKAAVFVEATSC